MNKLWIVVKEVYRKNVFSGSFIAMVLGPILMIVVIGLIGYFIGQSEIENSVGNIGIVGADQSIQAVLDQSESDNQYLYFNDQKEAEAYLKDEKINGFLVVESANKPIAATYYREKTGKDIDVYSIQSVLQNYQTQASIQELGISPDDLSAIESQKVVIPSVNLTFNEGGEVIQDDTNIEQKMMRRVVAYIVCFVVYMFIMTYIGIISQEIATEKGSRIMEIILSSISATKHFFGKMLGIGLVILTQILIYVALFLITRFVMNQLNMGDLLDKLPFNIADIVKNASNDLLLGGVFALFGILTYSSLAGFLGSLVSKTEDVNKTTTPLILLGVVGLYIGMYAFASANNPIVRIGSFIPFFTPFVMPFRVATETVSSGEIIISIIVSILFMIFCLWISAIFYKSNVLVTSDKGIIQTFKRSYQLWKSERTQN